MNADAPLTAAERQARHRQRAGDAMARLAAARVVVGRADEVVRLCGDVEVVATWHRLREALGMGDPDITPPPPPAER